MMAQYVVNLERLQALDLTVDVDTPDQALEAAKEQARTEGAIDWSQARIDQVCGACLAMGSGEYQVLAYKLPEE